MKQTLLLPLLAALLLAACHHSDYTPKPTAYLRFDLPAKEYSPCDSLPFAFECPKEARLVTKRRQHGELWADISYPSRNAVIYLTYKTLRQPDDLRSQVDTSYELLRQHFDHSTGMEEQRYLNPQRHVYATTCLLKGTNVASTYQFWATDSSRHFLRGALFLDCVPNNDSLAPLIAYLQQDIDHLIETLSWK